METPKEKLKKMAAWDVEPLLSESEARTYSGKCAGSVGVIGTS